MSVIKDGDDVPFIDDYIATKEDVQDYLTRFSGLKIGDLDPSSTSHFVTDLKVIILFYLTKLDCIFKIEIFS